MISKAGEYLPSFISKKRQSAISNQQKFISWWIFKWFREKCL